MITSRNIAINGYVVKFGIDFSKLAFSTDYTVKIPVGYTDINGQYMMAEESKVFTTPASFSIVNDGTAVAATPAASGVTVNVKLKNGLGVKTGAWIIAAAYGDFNRMIGVAEKKVEVTDTYTDTLTITEDCTDAKIIKFYIWNNQTDIKPLQASTSIWTKSVVD